MSSLTFGVSGINFEEVLSAEGIREQVQGKEFHIEDRSVVFGPEEGVSDVFAAEVSSELDEDLLMILIEICMFE